MPLVELLPTSSTAHVTPGWAYVPDPIFDPSTSAAAAAAATSSKLGRKRGTRGPGAAGGAGGGGSRTADLTSRQRTVILRHLAELDRENHRDVQIAVPMRPRDKDKDAARGSRNKNPSNVRRILQSQKTFKNYLDDEEAALAQAAQHQSSTTVPRSAASKVNKIASARSGTPASLGTSHTTTTSVAPSSKRISKSSRKSMFEPHSQLQQQQEQQQEAPPPDPAVPAAGAPTTVAATTAATEEALPNPTQQTLIKSQFDNDPLLKSYIPSAPSDRIMQLLLSEPPLTYNDSRARPSTSGYPPRYFCTICGYWGKMKCRSCGTRTCGLECYKVHEDSRCGAFF